MLFLQKLIQCQILLMGDCRRFNGKVACTIFGEQLIFIIFDPFHHILHRIEGNQPFGENRKPEGVLKHCRILAQRAFAQSLNSFSIGTCPSEAQQIHIALQMVGSYRLELALSNGVLLDAGNSVDIGCHSPIAQRTGFQFFLHPHIQHISQSDVLGLRQKHLGFIVLHRLAEQRLGFTLAFRSRKFLLDTVAAGILYIKAIVPLLSFLSYRSFCHSKLLSMLANGTIVMCHPDYSKGWLSYQTYRLLNFKVSIFTSPQGPDCGPEGRGPR